LGTILARRLPRVWHWVPYSVIGFVALNVWIRIAAETCLFWACLWPGKGSPDSLSQFHMKLLLMRENPSPIQVVLAGNSQLYTEIDPRLLNVELAPRVFSTELHSSGNRGFDFLFLDRKLAGQKVDVIVCYLSEVNFFLHELGPSFPLFFGFRNVPEFFRFGGKVQWSPRALGYGLLGDLLPVFRLRDACAQRLIGNRMLYLGVLSDDSGAAAGPKEDVHQRAAQFVKGDQSEFQMAAFEGFVARCAAENRKLLLCCGQVNPLLHAQLDPVLRPQMVDLLRRLAATYPNVRLLDERELPTQTPDEYLDFTHVNRAGQIRFTEAIRPALEKVIASEGKR
jgi:hypothetical protein